MLLDSVVRTSAGVAASPGRLAKIDQIAGLLRDVPAAEIAVAVSFLSGDLTQRQIGVGYAALTDLIGGSGADSAAAGLTQPVEVAQLTLAETDQALGQIGALSGTADSFSGSAPLRLTLFDATAALQPGEEVITFGSVGGRPYVPGVPVGTVTTVTTEPGSLTPTALVQPFADFTGLGVVGVVVSK